MKSCPIGIAKLLILCTILNHTAPAGSRGMDRSKRSTVLRESADGLLMRASQQKARSI